MKKLSVNSELTSLVLSKICTTFKGIPEYRYNMSNSESALRLLHNVTGRVDDVMTDIMRIYRW